MSKSLLTIIIVIGVLLTIWIIRSLVANRNLEMPSYTVTKQFARFEIRDYDSYIIAEVTVGANLDTGVNSAFRILAGYIFGGNKARESIAMTAPVATSGSGEKIAMTAPVTTTETQGMMTMNFMMPSQFTLETLPEPNNKRITFREVPSGTYAVLRTSGWMSQRKADRMEQRLRSLLERESIETVGNPEILQYNDPSVFPLVRRNEIRIAINQESL